MFVKVKAMDGSALVVVTISKRGAVKELRQLVESEMGVAPEQQRLFFRGKQMEDGHTMLDYGVNVNDVIQLMKRQVLAEPVQRSPMKSPPKKRAREQVQAAVSEYFNVGDECDAMDPNSGGWFEATVTAVKEVRGSLVYSAQFVGYDDEGVVQLSVEQLRERATVFIPFTELAPGMDVMVNYNVDEPVERGFWFDGTIKTLERCGNKRTVVATVYVGVNCVPLNNCKLAFVDEIMQRAPCRKLAERGEDGTPSVPPAARQIAVNCRICSDRPNRDCRICGCHVCHSKSRPEQQVMCDECDMPYHIDCLTPPLERIPDVDEWFCPECKNDESEVVRAGERLKNSKKRARAASTVNKTKRDWGRGMATAGRQKQCSIVPTNHFGSIPGVEVGMRWQYRIQASEAGVHRPHVAGIAGREKEGSFSIVLSGGYEDDVDNGEEFYYTGSGGRDLSGNKRTAEQSSDQLLTRMNRALALNCKAPINSKTGAEATDWRKGKPVRVVRSWKLHKHSDYAPTEGLRYDGIYKVIKYWPEPGHSGFLVWRFLMRRDDPVPAPWTKEGHKRILELGIQHMVTMDSKEDQSSTMEVDDDCASDQVKPSAYRLEPRIKELVDRDEVNRKLWDQCSSVLSEGKLKFIEKVMSVFECSCCQELVHRPSTLPCCHNVCTRCLLRSFKAEVYSCPTCRHDLGKKHTSQVNQSLSEALLLLFPGYDTGR